MDEILCPGLGDSCSICGEEVKFSKYCLDGYEDSYEDAPLSGWGRKVLDQILSLKPDLMQSDPFRHRTCSACDKKLREISEKIEDLVKVYKLSLFALGYTEADFDRIKSEQEHDKDRLDFASQVTENDLPEISQIRMTRSRSRKKSFIEAEPQSETTAFYTKGNSHTSDSLDSNHSLRNTKPDIPAKEAESECGTDRADELIEDENSAEDGSVNVGESDGELPDFDNFSGSDIKDDIDIHFNEENSSKATLEEASPKPNETALDGEIQNGMPKVNVKEDPVSLNDKPVSEKRRLRRQKLGKFTCQKCNRSFQTHYSLERHMKCHMSERPFQCTNCDKRFPTKSKRTRHFIGMHSNEKPFKCNKCPQQFKDKRALRNHAPAHTGEKLYECTVCKMAFVSSYTLNRHMCLHLGKKPTCSFCDRAFTNAADYREHMKNEHPENIEDACDVNFNEDDKPYKCDVCESAFVEAHHLKRHMHLHSGINPHKCSKCDSAFLRRDYLKSHMRKMHPEPVKCFGCDRSFTNPTDYKEHVKNEHPENIDDVSDVNFNEDAKSYKCDICECTFGEARHLKRHMHLHSGINLHKCSKCDSAFPRKDYLNSHMRKMHSEPVKCSKCDSSFTNAADYKEHVKDEHPENIENANNVNFNIDAKSYKCDVCECAFGDAHHLKRHMLLHSGINPHKCNKCDSAFPRRDYLISHMKMKHPDPVKCSKCDSSFTNSADYKEHFKSEHPDHTPDEVNEADFRGGGKQYNCDVCDRNFSRKYHLKRHMRSHLRRKPYKCPECDVAFALRLALKCHIKRFHRDHKPLTCSLCDSSFTTADNYIEHIKTEHPDNTQDTEDVHDSEDEALSPGGLLEQDSPSLDGTLSDEKTQSNIAKVTVKGVSKEEPLTLDGEGMSAKKRHENTVGKFTCHECDNTFQTRFTLVRHMKSHTGERPYQCSHCDKKFSTKYQRTRHNVSVHSKEKPFKCNICRQAFVEKKALTIHLRVHTGDKPYLCDVCEHAFASPYRLKLHMRSHLGIYPYKCSECDSAFTRSDSLKLHMRIHSGEKPVTCSLCGGTFRTRTNYMQHMKIKHTDNPRAYVCQVCSAAFYTKASLRNHSRIHTGEQPFLCSICGAAFRYQSSFDYHRKTHIADKPFKCPHCSKTFKFLQILREHIRTHTGEKPFMCAVCGKAFSQQGQLGRHSVIHTDVKAHKCNHCQKAFNRKDKLTYHLQKMHNEALSKEKKSFEPARSDILRLHKCPICDKSYTRKSKVKEHLSKVHNDVNETVPTESTDSGDVQGSVSPITPSANLHEAVKNGAVITNQSDVLKSPDFTHHPTHDLPSDVLTSPNAMTSQLLPQGSMGYTVPYPTLNQSMCQELSMSAVMNMPNVPCQYGANK